MSTVLTLGTFDLFHVGHVNLLRRCEELSGRGNGRVVVGLNTDGFVARYKGRQPVIDYEGRLAVVAACRYVTHVLPNDQPDGSIRDVLQQVQPHLVVVGSDWQDRDYLGQLGISPDELRAYGTGLVYLPYTEGVSTTRIRERIA